MSTGRVTHKLGPIVDIQFDQDHLPEINNAIKIQYQGEISSELDLDLTVEVALNKGITSSRCIAMYSTDGVVRAWKRWTQVSSITIPVGRPTLGRCSTCREIHRRKRAGEIGNRILNSPSRNQ